MSLKQRIFTIWKRFENFVFILCYVENVLRLSEKRRSFVKKKIRKCQFDLFDLYTKSTIRTFYFIIRKNIHRPTSTFNIKSITKIIRRLSLYLSARQPRRTRFILILFLLKKIPKRNGFRLLIRTNENIIRFFIFFSRNADI